MRPASILLALLLATNASASPPGSPPLAVDRQFSVLPADASTERQLEVAASRLANWAIDLAGVPLDGPRLAQALARPDPSLTRRLREALGRPVDPEDLAYLLDDVLAAEDRRGERFHIHSGRARASGVLLHPDDIFRARPRRYPDRPTLDVDLPKPQAEIDTPAADGDLAGPAWTVRYQNPSEREAMLEALAAERPEADFAERIRTLLDQLGAAGAEVYLASTTRSRERGYLMWGAFLLSRADTEAEVDARLATLADRNRAWGLDIDIRWQHPDGWRATIEAARAMADTYDVVYATEGGARSSNHYGGQAADLIALDLPRRLTLTAPDGATRSFLLSAPEEPRDLSLTPRLIEWIEAHWQLRKLHSDYPHWSDATLRK